MTEAFPCITVVIPVYNGMPYLVEAIASVQQQSWPNMEILAVNDGSTDNSGAYLESLSDKRIRVIHQVNMGLAATLNRAFQEARGEIIARLDQDDYCMAERITRQYEMLVQGPWDALFTHIHKFGAVRGWDNRDRQRPQKAITVPLQGLRDGCQLHSTLMLRKVAFLRVGGYRQACYPCDDWDLQLRLEETCKVGILAEPLVCYRMHSRASTYGAQGGFLSRTSYKNFFIMQHKSRWVEACALARRSGIAEPEYEIYEASQRHFLWRRINRFRKDLHRYYIRMSGECYLNGHLPSMVLAFVLATVLWPKQVILRSLRTMRLLSV